MTEQFNSFRLPHYVILTLHQNTKVDIHPVYSAERINHRKYYAELERLKKVICYGEIMNQTGICIILAVSSENEFENIIMNDPGINSGFLKVKKVIPFSERTDMDCTFEINH